MLDLAKKRGDGCVQEQLSTFFKAPMVKNGHGPEHAFASRSDASRLARRSLMSDAAAPAALRELFVEMNDLKRVHSAGRDGSIAERMFAQGWGLLTGGASPEDVALDITATTLAATRLCDLDAAFLAAAGLSDAAASAVLVARLRCRDRRPRP